MLELREIVKIYPAGDNSVEALKGIDLRFRDSEFVSILGQSGCGKTTLINILGGMDRDYEGIVSVDGHDLNELNYTGIADYRKGVFTCTRTLSMK